jgi:DNA-binding NarL/FixJ family response regulator
MGRLSVVVAAAQERLDSARPRALVVLVGDWPAVPDDRAVHRARRMVFRHGPAEARSLKELVATQHPEWLLIGLSVDESTVRSLTASGQAMHPELQLAMLGPADDLRRCARWVRRGCHVYLECSAGVRRVAAALDAATAMRLVIIDRVFLEAARARQAPLVGSLTRREEEVLQLVCQGLRNADVAQELHVTESTVEFHVTRVLAKLGARNRVEAVDRAVALGLA